MKTFSKPSDAIKWTKERLLNQGYVVKTEKWQGVSSPDDMWETMNHSFQFFIPETIEDLISEVNPNLPWADEHFDERVSGKPYNPPPSHVNWPFAQKDNSQFGGHTRFSHTYPERIWPKYAGSDVYGEIQIDDIKEFKKNPNNLFTPKYPLSGVRFNYGDFNDVVNLLHREPFTRQAFLPIWFPEDTGTTHNERVPCTIGYHFMRRDNRFHIVYFIRSCDCIRHFRDDIYLACRKLMWTLEKLKKMDNASWKDVKPGYFAMHIVSLHCFNKEKGILKQSNI